MRQRMGWALIVCSCPDDHEVMAVYTDHDEAVDAIERWDGAVARRKWEPDDPDETWSVYVKEVPLNPMPAIVGMAITSLNP